MTNRIIFKLKLLKIRTIAFIIFTIFYLLISTLKVTPVYAEGNPFVPTTDILDTGLSAQVGADELNTASQNIANFKDITGAYYDSSLNRIVFIGTTGGTNPNYNQDDMAVAVKSLFYNNTLPSLSIDDDPNNPSGPTAVVNYTGSIQNTNFASDLFNADYKLKQYAIGYNPSQVKVTSTVGTYQSVVDRYTALNPNPVAGNESKFIISPQTVAVKNATSASAISFSNLTMQVTAQAVNQNNDSLWNQAATNFANDMSANYDQYGQETTYFVQAKQLAKIMAILKWVSDYSIPTDSLVARNYTPQVVSTPSTVQKVSTPTGYFAQGAVNYNAPNTYLPDDGTAANLKTAAQSGSSSNQDVTWNFTSNGQQYQAVAIASGAFKSLGSYSTSVTDMSIPIAGDLSLTFKRSYSSFSNGQFGIGQGWDFIPARLYSNSQPQSFTICNNVIYNTKLALDTLKGHETFTYNCPSGYSPDDPSFHSSIAQNGDGSFTATLTDQTKYNFNSSGQLISNIDKNNNAINYTYDGSSKLTSIADTHSHQFTVAYNAQNLISSVTDWTNRKVQYVYDTSGRLTGVTDPNNNTTNYTYDSNGRLATITDRNGQLVLTNTYQSDARIATSKNAANLLTTHTYDNVNRLITQTDSNNRVTKTTYDSKARIVQQTDPANKNIAYTYGNETVPLTYTDRNNNQQIFTYDPSGNMLSATFPGNSVINYTYDNKNRLTMIQDGRYGNPAKQTTFTYDANGNLTQKNEAGLTTSYTYDATGERLTSTDPLNNITTYTRDSLGNILTQRDPYNNTTTFNYDAIGRQTKITDASNNIINFTYDANGNLLTKVNSVGTTTNTYDKENRLTKVTAPNNTITQFTYNSSGSKTSIIDALNNTTNYGYDAYQNLTSQQDALNHTTTNAFNNLNKQTSTTTPLGKATSYQFDANGNITQRTDANNKVTNYQYDALNRLTKITYPDTSIITYQYDNRGNMTRMVDPNGTSTYIYDNFDRMTRGTNQYNQAIQYVYDNDNNLTQLTYPDGKVVNYTYDKNNRMKTVTDWNSKITTYNYNNNGTLGTRVYPNGITTYYTYDNANRLKTIEHKNGATSYAKFDYTRDSIGNIKVATDSGQLVGLTLANTFSYDNTNKLTATNYNVNFSPTNIAFTNDAVGNITIKNDSSQGNPITYTYDSDNKLTTTSQPYVGTYNYSYDNNGNETQKNAQALTQNITYDFENKITKVTRSQSVDTYKYDGLGNRMEYDDSFSNKTRYITDTTSSLPRILENYSLVFNSTKGWYLYGLGVLAEWTNYSDNTSAVYYLEDGMGNIRFTTLYNGSGGGQTVYNNPYSDTSNSGGNPAFKFSTQLKDNDTGFYYMRARDYDPSTGRFLQRDPVAGGLSYPISQNAYQYAYDNPVNLSDPSGRSVTYGELLRLANQTVRGIYEFISKSGKPYIGRSVNIPRRLMDHLRSGKLDENDLQTLRVYNDNGDIQTLRITEQNMINQSGGVRSGKLENKIDSISSQYWEELEIEPPIIIPE